MSFLLQQFRRLVPSNRVPLLWQRYVTEEAVKRERQKITLNDSDLIEKFVKGSGPGGQCVNKRVSCVDLRHIPTGIRVQCQQTRSLEINRHIARKLLKDKIDEVINGDLSKYAQKAAKINKAKARKARRAKKKYGSKDEIADGQQVGDGVIDPSETGSAA
ncbi:RF-1 domain-containing protein [Zychaea mexicana]|uniref:RF-1 domain-containing protein n=1 Tax=Zychaea mexicana TaxID=64656 RepID=UPI0022FEC4A6|nr:RF-1 domain-containing protein [Zychaea mexicana]KAI9493724.1 RF-1 domain-containing protein [Zychaea mexicana]